MRIAQEHDRVLLISLSDGKRKLLRLVAGHTYHSHKGTIRHDDLIGRPLGRQLLSHVGQPFVVLWPSIHDVLMNVKRVSQIVYPKEMGLALLKLDLGPGKRVIEAGTGSGALTIGLAHAVQPTGAVYSYDMRGDMLTVAERNLRAANLLDYVQLIERDIAEGFTERDVDAVFLDVREPSSYLGQVCEALRDGGFFGALVPTTNQVSDLLAGMAQHPFVAIEAMEIWLRELKPVPDRLRPQDVMVGHTGYLIFARKISPAPPDVKECWGGPTDEPSEGETRPPAMGDAMAAFRQGDAEGAARPAVDSSQEAWYGSEDTEDRPRRAETS
ncbi:MAG: tRNA (adenine-N1)-methyltransferase [Chloroflexi bacterium]|nr:tRNA (adenine-N1)-methyltransferase [Chloroflexota bacterium]